MTARTFRWVHVTRLGIYPTGTLHEPIMFESFADAQNFSRITGRLIYGTTGAGVVWRIYPGGRIEEYGADLLRKDLERRAWRAARKAKVPA